MLVSGSVTLSYFPGQRRSKRLGPPPHFQPERIDLEDPETTVQRLALRRVCLAPGRFLGFFSEKGLRKVVVETLKDVE